MKEQSAASTLSHLLDVCLLQELLESEFTSFCSNSCTGSTEIAKEEIIEKRYRQREYLHASCEGRTQVLFLSITSVSHSLLAKDLADLR